MVRVGASRGLLEIVAHSLAGGGERTPDLALKRSRSGLEQARVELDLDVAARADGRLFGQADLPGNAHIERDGNGVLLLVSGIGPVGAGVGSWFVAAI
jgi:hypothetical protein